jgi:hypothetical protein
VLEGCTNLLDNTWEKVLGMEKKLGVGTRQIFFMVIYVLKAQHSLAWGEALCLISHLTYLP